MKKLLLLVLALGVMAPAFAAPGHKMPPPSYKGWQMLDEDWDARFMRYEKKIKSLVRAYKRERPDSYKAQKLKKDLSKEIARLRKDQISMQKENLRSLKRDLKDLQEGLSYDQRVYRHRWAFLDHHARAHFAHQIYMRRHAVRDFQRQILEMEKDIVRASRSSNRARWVARKTIAAIKFNGNMKVFFEGDVLFAPRGMSVPPSSGPSMMPPPPSAMRPVFSHPPMGRPGHKAPHAKPETSSSDKPQLGSGGSSDNQETQPSPSQGEEDTGVQLGPTGNQPTTSAPATEEEPKK